MEKIKDNIIIANAIIEIDKQEIKIKDILMYSKKISLSLKESGYFVENISSQSIYNFFRMFPHIGQIKEKKIIIKPDTKIKLKKYILTKLNEDELSSLKKYNKYIFPILHNNKLVNYHFVSNNEILQNIKQEFYYDDKKNDAYLIDIEVIKNSKEVNNIELFLNELFNIEKIIKKDEMDYNNFIKFENLIYEFDNPIYKEIKKYFEMNDNYKNSIYEVLFRYSNIAYNNKINLEENKVLTKLIK